MASARTTTSRSPIVSAMILMTAPTQPATFKCLGVTGVKSLNPKPPPETSSASGVRRMPLIYANLIRTGNPNNHSRIPTVPGRTKPAKSMPNGSPVQADVGPSWTCVGATQVQQYHVDTVAKFGCCGPNGKYSCWNESNHASTPLSVFLLLTLTALNSLL